MQKTCDSCKGEKNLVTIPYVAHESMMYRLERTNKRLWIALVIALILLLISIVR